MDGYKGQQVNKVEMFGEKSAYGEWVLGRGEERQKKILSQSSKRSAYKV